MIQTVGIKFEAQGLGTVAAEMKTLATSVASVVKAVKGLESLNTTAAITNLNKLAAGMTSAASQLVAAASQINSATTSFTAANSVMGKTTGGQTQAAAATTGSSKNQHAGLLGDTVTTTGRLLKYSAAFGAVYGAKQFAESALMGESRKGLLDSQLNLHSIGYKTKEDKRGVEYAAKDFVASVRGNIKTEEFMKSVAEMGSALPHDDPNSPAMNKQTHIELGKIAVAFGKLSQMTPDAASQHLESLVSAIYNMGSPDTKWRMRNEQGYLSNYAGNMAGQAYKAIDIFKMRGQDQAEFMKYMTPTMLEKGWDFPTMLSLAGLATTVGFKASSTGRGSKTLLDAHPEKLGELLLAGSSDKNVAAKYRDSKAADKKAAGMAEFRKYEDEFRGDFAGWLQNRLGPAAQKAQGYGFNMADFSGTNFLPLMRMLTNPEAIKELQKAINIIRTESPKGTGIVDEYQKALGDDNAATRLDALSASWTRMTQAIADSSNPMVTFTGNVVDLTTKLMNWSAKLQEKFNKEDKNEPGLKGLFGETPYFLKKHSNYDMSQKLSSVHAFNDVVGDNMPLSDLQRRSMASLTGDNYQLGSKDMYAGSNMNMFKPPEIAPAWREHTQRVSVEGQAEVTVTISDQGFFERVKKTLLRLEEKGVVANTGEGLGNVANSTGRMLGSYNQVQPDFQGGQ